MTSRTAPAWLLLLIVVVLNGALLWHFHDRYWYPTDDGFYAHLAERLLGGEILNRDIQDIHPGYIHFLHAAAFWLFGVDMLSLRYPLMAASLAQAAIVFTLLRRKGAVDAILGSLSLTALGVIQFFDPTPNWYCLLFCVLLAGWMIARPVTDRVRLVGAGVLLGVLTLFRQLSGVWVAMALLVIVLMERSGSDRAPRGVVGRGVLGIMVVALLGYLALSPETEPGGLLLIALWPLAILVWAITTIRITDGDAARAIGQVAAGTAIPALPLLIYHLAHRSLGTWISDTVFAGFGETQMPFFGHGWYGILPIAAAYQMVTSFRPALMANGWYWTALPLLSVVNGGWILASLRQHRDPNRLILPIFAAFYALVSLYLEGPLYLYYAVGLSSVAVLWQAADRSPRWRRVSRTTVAGAIVVAVVCHAGQSRLRTPVQILHGDRSSEPPARRAAATLPRSALRVASSEREAYTRILNRIEAATRPGDTIFALPNDAELYFMSRRRNPFRFYNSALGILNAADLEAVMIEFRQHPPRLVAFRPDDKYNAEPSRHIMGYVQAHYDRIDTIDGLDLYTWRTPTTD